VTDLAAEERHKRLSEQGRLIVTKTGVGKDVYAWRDAFLQLDHGALIIRDAYEVLLHAYSAGTWLEVTLEEEP
jgi:hypothetical protein